MSTSAGKPPVMRNATQATCASRKRAIRWPTITGVLQTRRDPGRIVMADTPENLRFGEDHLWADPAGDPLVRVGITDYAQQSLGDVIAVTPRRSARPSRQGKPAARSSRRRASAT